MGRSRTRSRSRGRSNSSSSTASYGSEGNDSCRVHIADLCIDASKHEIERAFEACGPLIEVWVARVPPCFAFVVFKYSEDAMKAIQMMDGQMLCGNRVRVSHAKPRVRNLRRSDLPPRNFRTDLRCYQCGKTGHFSRNCGAGMSRYAGFRRNFSSASSHSRSKSRSRSPRRRRERTRSRSQPREKTRSRSRDRGDRRGCDRGRRRSVSRSPQKSSQDQRDSNRERRREDSPKKLRQEGSREKSGRNSDKHKSSRSRKDGADREKSGHRFDKGGEHSVANNVNELLEELPL